MVCFALYGIVLWLHVFYLPIFFMVVSLALGQSYDCPSACEATLKNVSKNDQYQNTIESEKRA